MWFLLFFSVAAFHAPSNAIVSQVQRVVARVLLLSEPRIVWCRVEPGGGIWHIRTRPGGPEVPHGATMSAKGARWAYYYPWPTPLLRIAQDLGLCGACTVDLLATGREVTTRTGRWREFRRAGKEEFEAALASWKREPG
jgi:hypothetical protein